MADYPDYTDLMHIVGTDITIPIEIEASVVTLEINLVAAEIMMPMDIQGAYIMMPVDIQAQYLTLDIDITAQSVGNIRIDLAAQSIGNIAINIAASAITLDINIKSITGGVTFNIGTVTGTVNMNIKSITAGVTFNIGTIAGTVTVSITGTANIDITAQSVGIHSEAEWAASKGDSMDFCLVGNNKGTGATISGSHTVPANKKYYICGISFRVNAYTSADGDKNQMGEVTLQDLNTGKLLLQMGGNGGNAITFPKPILIPGGHKVEWVLWNWANHNCDLGISLWGYEI